jgi:subtilisin family serine protease
MRRIGLFVVLAVSLVAAPALTANAAAAVRPQRMVDVVVVLGSQADLGAVHAASRPARLRAVEQSLRAHAGQTQKGVLSLLASRQAQGVAADIVPLWIANEVAVRATPAVVRELAARPDVREVRPEFTVAAPAAATAAAATTTVEPNVALAGAPDLWSRGLRGQGIVVANLDTGVDASHPDLAARWRGGSNSWYDPNGQHPTTPTDVNGHGTQTMSLMVGGDSGGSSIGIAPDAKWIAVKIFNDRGTATSTGIHQGFQWLLDPDGNPATADAPNVVNDSWTMATASCALDFQLDLRSLRAAGILPVFAAGNYGPGAGTVQSPANLPEAFAVGGTDNSDALYPYSSRGPSACSGTIAPKLTAPAVDIRTADLYGGYALDTGTSVAAPHVAGALALLLDAFPGLTADQQEAALEGGAVDLGATGVDNDFGYGRLDAFAAYQRLAGSPDFTVSASPSSATVSPGASASYAVSVAAMNGFAGDVSLTMSGLPPSVGTATFAPATITGSGGSQLTVDVSASAPPGTYPLSVDATSGATRRSAALTLIVSGPPDFSMSGSPSAQSVVAGAGVSFTVGVSSLDGFTGDVFLSVTGLPASVGSASLTPAVIAAAGSSQLNIATVASAPVGTYPLTVTGTSGSTTHAASVTLTVKAPPDFSVAATPASRTVNAGTGTSYSVSVGALNGFVGSVTLSVAGLPASVGTATLTPSAVTGSGTSQLAVTTYSNAAGGSYQLTITGVSGSITHAVPVTLAVVARDFTLSGSPSSVTVIRGHTASYTVSTSSLGGFTGSVSLSLSGQPTGTTTSWSANPITTPGTATLRVRTTGSTPRGTFALNIFGVSGSLSHQANVTLVVH